ncbi:hypothetical protein ASE17_19845 [Phenylobacterium sp. Root77]|jgi:hypothetical protein|uniref:hypothetical protein n=1 Tax=unclassified Phenylobacterium TaxID=2640670 RepID=UPI0006FF0F9D|nr:MULTISPECIES: hypothetical protein [unclassified Phenylobacterium]KQW66980.1 hypothetical protein ASC73_17760 [Phenylobacterium sp. Root1277]KQW89673.1 hypothetical protein ASC79_18665 [Phenylobacterium sp. Root1290]KRC43459.1 hypothetical protein ASE17_19845 [Phenylobacterium sp. Root77]
MWLAIAGCLIAPLVAMQFTEEVAWTGHDFAFAALLLLAGGGAIELSCRSRRTLTVKSMLVLAIMAFVAAIWADGAVGVF